MDKTLYSITEVAELLGISRTLIKQLRKTGKLKTTVLGGKIFVHKNDLDNLLSENKTNELLPNRRNKEKIYE